MKRFFTVTNFLDCQQTVNLEYLVGVQEVKEGEDKYVTLSMVHPTDDTTMYDIRVKEDFKTISNRVVQAGYM